ncbi:hypothetical protein ABFS83_02G085600 [Erythranthe nasuta]
MALQCYPKFLHRFKKLIGDRNNGDDDIQRTDSPMILRYFCCPDYLRISVIDWKSEKECKLSILKTLKRAYFVGCCNGLALFTSDNPSRMHIVVNPLSCNMATIYGPFKGGDPCGFFFHPSAKEYRILNVRKIEKDKYEYHVYLFGTNKWRKIPDPYFKYEPTRHWSRRKKGQKTVNGNPAIVNDALHWDIGAIMVFDMISEGFTLRSAPFKETKGRKYVTRHLSANENRLCYCHLGCEEPVMDVWIMEDYEKWSWVKKYVVDLDFDMNMYPMDNDFRFTTLSEIMGYVTIVGTHNNELVLFWKRRGMFSCRLGFNTVKKIPLRKSEMDWHMHEFNWLCGFELYSAI